MLGGTVDQTGTVTLVIRNLHGDVVSSMADSSSATGPSGTYSESTEFGAARGAANAPDSYGWLGGQQRSTNSLGGLSLMGVRLYDPSIGRFLSTDHVLGGNDNPYVYVLNPNDEFDLNGECNPFRHFKECLRKAAVSTFGGALIGLLKALAPALCVISAAIKPFCGAIVGALAYGGASALQQWAKTGHVNWTQVIVDAVMGAIAGSGLQAAIKTKIRNKLQNQMLSVMVWLRRVFHI
ncbi:MAG: hypothetical protein JWN95_2508 [Frankiales bacterium]|nr:hypothetical protein [Frankiales bacterium]